MGCGAGVSGVCGAGVVGVVGVVGVGKAFYHRDTESTDKGRGYERLSPRMGRCCVATGGVQRNPWFVRSLAIRPLRGGGFPQCLRPIRGSFLLQRTSHGFRSLRVAGFAAPVATTLRPIGGESRVLDTRSSMWSDWPANAFLPFSVLSVSLWCMSSAFPASPSCPVPERDTMRPS